MVNKQRDESQHRARLWLEQVLFCVLAYALAWSAWIPLWSGGQIVSKGALPTHLPGLLAPALAALAVTLFKGRGALIALLHRLLRLPTRATDWLLALSPLAMIAIVLLFGADVSGLERYSGIPPLPFLATLLLVLVVNGLGEEIGWRGFLLPRAQALLGVRTGTLASGTIWALWHLPMFFVLETYRTMGLLGLVFGFGVGILAGACVLAHMTARAHGGVVLAVLWHTGFNLGTGTALGGLAPALLSTLAIIWALWLLRYAPEAMRLPIT
ncbi:MAG: CPBP family intramembrane glutamic endopeptidase [Deinococcales bacterium]